MKINKNNPVGPDDNHEKSLAALAYLKLSKAPCHTKTERSSVTTEWGVDWDEDLIARDIMQNFYDANKENVDAIRVEVENDIVTISAPAQYNLERLFYLGSEKKGTENVGQYGEGFKVAAVCLLRDHRVTPIALCGEHIVCMRIAENAVAGTELYPLVYDHFQTDAPCTGTKLILTHCSKKLVEAIKKGLENFLYPGNPLLGKLLWSSGDEKLRIHESRVSAHGYVFYNNLKRGDIPDIPIVLVIQKEIRIIENNVKQDRDRKAFGDKLMAAFYRHFSTGIKWHSSIQELIVTKARHTWPKGHPLLSAMADGVRWKDHIFNKEAAARIFGDKYFAKCVSDAPLEKMRFDEIEELWLNEGRLKLPGYFEKFGVLSAESYIREVVKEDTHRNKRAPTVSELKSYSILKNILKEFVPEIMAIFDKRSVSLTVAKTEAVLGELKKGRDYRSLEVFLAEQVFEADFAAALAIMLHEHGHVFGHDGSRGFTDVLTDILENIIRHRDILGQYEKLWQEAGEAVRAERRIPAGSREEAIDKKLEKLSEVELRALFRRLPLPQQAQLLKPVE